MTNSFYNHTSGIPVTQSRGTASTVRAEYDLVGVGFDGVQTALALKAPLASPTFTGVPAAPTATAGDNSTTLATTAFVTAVGNLAAGIGATGTSTSSQALAVGTLTFTTQTAK